MATILAGKGLSRYQIHIKGNSFPKTIFNQAISKDNKTLIITDSGIPKKHIKRIKDAMVSISSSEYHMFSIPLEVSINSGNNWGEAH